MTRQLTRQRARKPKQVEPCQPRRAHAAPRTDQNTPSIQLAITRKHRCACFSLACLLSKQTGKKEEAQRQRTVAVAGLIEKKSMGNFSTMEESGEEGALLGRLLLFTSKEMTSAAFPTEDEMWASLCISNLGIQFAHDMLHVARHDGGPDAILFSETLFPPDCRTCSATTSKSSNFCGTSICDQQPCGEK